MNLRPEPTPDPVELHAEPAEEAPTRASDEDMERMGLEVTPEGEAAIKGPIDLLSLAKELSRRLGESAQAVEVVFQFPSAQAAMETNRDIEWADLEDRRLFMSLAGTRVTVGVRQPVRSKN